MGSLLATLGGGGALRFRAPACWDDDARMRAHTAPLVFGGYSCERIGQLPGVCGLMKSQGVGHLCGCSCPQHAYPQRVMTLGIQTNNSGVNHSLALPDESGLLLSSNSSSCMLRSVGMLTGLAVTGAVRLKALVARAAARLYVRATLRARALPRFNDSNGSWVGISNVSNGTLVGVSAELYRAEWLRLGGSVLFNRTRFALDLLAWRAANGTAANKPRAFERVLRLAMVEPRSNSTTATFPDETGALLSDVSNFSTLQMVSRLNVGSLAKGFGAARPGSLTATGRSELRANSTCGGNATLRVRVPGTVDGGHAMLFSGEAGSGGLGVQLDVARLSAQRTTTLPDLDGSVLTEASTHSTLSAVAGKDRQGGLSVGSIVSGFGDATLEKLTATGKARLLASSVLGTSRSDSVKLLGRIATSNILIDPDGAGGTMTLVMTDPASEDRVISLPNSSGDVMLSTTVRSSMSGMGRLTSGASCPCPPSPPGQERVSGL